MTPTDHTSTLLEILGGSFPTTKHSGGKYLKERERERDLKRAQTKDDKGRELQHAVFPPIFIKRKTFQNIP